jgi:hypothetical protein
MADIEIVSGFVSEIMNTGAGFSFSIGTPPISLTLGAIPTKTAGLPEAFTLRPLDNSDWVAVAVRRSAFQGSGYALLSYRRLGQCGPARPANFTLAAWVLVLSVFAIAVSFSADDFTSGLGYAACFALLAIPCVLRLLSVRKATRLLRDWEPPPVEPTTNVATNLR